MLTSSLEIVASEATSTIAIKRLDQVIKAASVPQKIRRNKGPARTMHWKFQRMRNTPAYV
jgi:hypothetical protein